MSLAEDALNRALAATALDKKQNELREKKLELEHSRVTAEYSDLVLHQDELARMENLDLSKFSPETIEELVKKNDDYIDAAKKKIRFITEAFDEVIPFFQKNLILIGASTGNGKSTVVANVVRTLLMQRRPDGNLRKVLVITNEEAAEDCYNRVTALMKGWHYSNHDRITPEQQAVYSKNIRFFTEKQLLTVIDNNFGGINGMTRTIEGIEGIFRNIIKNKLDYDCILLDYYQNVNSSKLNPKLAEWEVQGKLAQQLDAYKNILPCPIVLLAQINMLTDDKDKTPFEVRIKGRKMITDPCTAILEMRREAEFSRTKWVIQKSRFTDAIGKDFYTGFDRGAIVEYTDAFMKIAADRRDAFMKREVAKATGKEVKEKNEPTISKP